MDNDDVDDASSTDEDEQILEEQPRKKQLAKKKKKQTAKSKRKRTSDDDEYTPDAPTAKKAAKHKNRSTNDDTREDNLPAQATIPIQAPILQPPIQGPQLVAPSTQAPPIATAAPLPWPFLDPNVTKIWALNEQGQVVRVIPLPSTMSSTQPTPTQDQQMQTRRLDAMLQVIRMFFVFLH